MEDIYYIKGDVNRESCQAIPVNGRFSQKELASKTGITRQTLSLIEKGTYNPSLKLCLNLCHALNQTLDTVFWVEPS